MPHPKQKHSHARTHKRRAHHALQPKAVVACSNCGTTIQPHTLCQSCGHYGKRNVLNIDEKRSRKEERAMRRQQKLEKKHQEEVPSESDSQTRTKDSEAS